MANGNDHLALEDEFRAAGIDVATPGFCDSPGFMRAEGNDRDLLRKYGRYIRARPFDAAYADRVRRRVPQVVGFLTAELARDGRLGACIDASGVALRFLEREGIWGFCAVGSLVVKFVDPRGRTVILHHFMHPDNRALVGHAWLCVPPLDIADLTIQAQPRFTDDERRRLTPVLAEGVPTTGDVAVHELAEPELLALIRREHGRNGRLDDFVEPSVRSHWQRSPPRLITVPSVQLKYIECGVMGSDGTPLEQMRNLVLSGKVPRELHAEFIAAFPAD